MKPENISFDDAVSGLSAFCDNTIKKYSVTLKLLEAARDFLNAQNIKTVVKADRKRLVDAMSVACDHAYDISVITELIKASKIVISSSDIDETLTLMDRDALKNAILEAENQLKK